MFESLYEQATTFLSNNKIASGGITIALFSSALYLSRSIPQKLFDLAKRRFLLNVEILDDDPAFGWFSRWLSNHDYMRKSRRLSVVTKFGDRNGAQNEPTSLRRKKDSKPKVYFVPAPGYHLVRYRGGWFLVHRNRQDSTSSGDGGSMLKAIRPESWEIQTPITNRKRLASLLEEARDLSQPDDDTTQEVWVAMAYGGWRRVGAVTARPLSTVFTNGVGSNLVEDLKWFQDNPNWYRDRGIPWRRGFLLYGPPGNGKSSLIRAVANELGMAIGTINLSEGISDSALHECLSEAGPETLIVMEDVDCIFDQRETTDDASDKLSFSGFLNAVDGVASSEGRVIAMTTNHPEMIEPALKRPGRCDRSEYVGPPNQHQVKLMFMNFFPDCAEESAEAFGEKMADGERSMATIQNHLILYSHGPREALVAAERDYSRESVTQCHT